MKDPLGIEVAEIPSVTKDHIAFFGCSYTRGIGLNHESEHYATQMANELGKLPLNFAKRGLNNYSIFDLFSQCNFVDEDIPVVIQLTQLNRVQAYNSGIKNIMLSNLPTKCLLEVYNDKFLIFEMVKQLRMLVNYARLKKLKFIIWSIAKTDNEELDNAIEIYLSKYPEYISTENRLGVAGSYRVDNGSDGTLKLGTGHPGPKSNILIAQKLLTHYRDLYL